MLKMIFLWTNQCRKRKSSAKKNWRSYKLGLIKALKNLVISSLGLSATYDFIVSILLCATSMTFESVGLAVGLTSRSKLTEEAAAPQAPEPKLNTFTDPLNIPRAIKNFT